MRPRTYSRPRGSQTAARGRHSSEDAGRGHATRNDREWNKREKHRNVRANKPRRRSHQPHEQSIANRLNARKVKSLFSAALGDSAKIDGMRDGEGQKATRRGAATADR